MKINCCINRSYKVIIKFLVNQDHFDEIIIIQNNEKAYKLTIILDESADRISENVPKRFKSF